MAAHGGMMRGPITLALPHPTTMDPALPVQAQLDAYNARDLERFVACYADDVQLYRPPAAEPVLQGKAAMAAHYAAHRFKLPLLHAELVNRMVLGNTQLITVSSRSGSRRTVSDMPLPPVWA
jgi:hypothetical protein